ncbi:hypothetical protein C8A05DRAFT_14969 [Staphylotrichum tortipilum]|uniref:Uncharacterized protein n=1 Tax=Staphylotrichum tortipilum TaxID=2831512 RepID=A0AAN6RUJ6_9PEZI|nr:hypothetical protein C8A05DRAFT_14969 [Staphylotrichum longicolle]
MLIACLPNLTRLNLSGGRAFRCIPLPALRAAHVTSLSIRAIDFSCSFGSVDNCLSGIFELALPSLTTLSLGIPGGSSLRSVANVVPPSLRHLYITGEEPQEADLAALLSRCVILETFVLETAGRPCIPFLPPEPVKHLIGNRENLRALHLDFTVPFWSVQPEFMNETFLTELTPQLRHFPVLQSLFLNTAAVYGAGHDLDEGLIVPLGKILPPSIVSLTMAENDLVSPRLANLAADLRQIAEAARKGQFPRLKTVVCDTPGPLEDGGLGDLFAKAGVDFRYEDRLFSGGAYRLSTRMRWAKAADLTSTE